MLIHQCLFCHKCLYDGSLCYNEGMNSQEAVHLIDLFYKKDNPSEKDESIYVNALKYLIENKQDAAAMSELAGFYYEKKQYDLAEKYYLLANKHGDSYAPVGLGYIYYYGRNGVKDYKKAFFYYSKAAKLYGNREAKMKIADMLENGYGCTKDLVAARQILLDLYTEIKDTTNLADPYPEVVHRLGAIYIAEGKGKDAVPMLERACDFIRYRIRVNPFWGNFVVAQKLIEELDSIYPPDEGDLISFYDLFYVFQKPGVAKLIYHEKTYLIKAFEEEGKIKVKIGRKVYSSVYDFLENALFQGKHIYVIDLEEPYLLIHGSELSKDITIEFKKKPSNEA